MKSPEDLSDENKTTLEINLPSGWGPTDIYYFGPLTKSIAIFGEIDRRAALIGISQALQLDLIDNEEPLTVYINTEGGSLTDALSIYDCLRSIDSPITTIATGSCASAGILLLMAGDERYATENTLFYYHQPILTTEDFISAEQFKGAEKGYTFCQERYDKIVTTRSRMKKTTWKTDFKGKLSKHFAAEEALGYNFIDEIIANKNKKN